MKDYDYKTSYHLEKANIVVDTLSRKFGYSIALLTTQKQILKDLDSLDIIMVIGGADSYIANFSSNPTLIERIKKRKK